MIFVAALLKRALISLPLYAEYISNRPGSKTETSFVADLFFYDIIMVNRYYFSPVHSSICSDTPFQCGADLQFRFSYKYLITYFVIRMRSAGTVEWESFTECMSYKYMLMTIWSFSTGVPLWSATYRSYVNFKCPLSRQNEPIRIDFFILACIYLEYDHAWCNISIKLSLIYSVRLLYINLIKYDLSACHAPDPYCESYSMMTSSNGNIFRVTGSLCGEFTGHRWIPLTKASDAELWWLLWSAPD